MQVNQSISQSVNQSISQKGQKANNSQKVNSSHVSEFCSSATSNAIKANSLVKLSFKKNNANLDSTLNELANPDFSKQLIQSILDEKSIKDKNVIETKQKILNPTQYLMLLNHYEKKLDMTIKDLKAISNKSDEDTNKLIELNNIKKSCQNIKKLMPHQEEMNDSKTITFKGDKAKVVKAAGEVIMVGGALVGLGIAIFCPALIPAIVPYVEGALVGGELVHEAGKAADKDD